MAITAAYKGNSIVLTHNGSSGNTLDVKSAIGEDLFPICLCNVYWYLPSAGNSAVGTVNLDLNGYTDTIQLRSKGDNTVEYIEIEPGPIVVTDLTVDMPQVVSVLTIVFE